MHASKHVWWVRAVGSPLPRLLWRDVGQAVKYFGSLLWPCVYSTVACGTEAVRCPVKLCEPSIACLLLHFGALTGFPHSDSFIVSDTSGIPIFPTSAGFIFPFMFTTPFTLSQAVCKLADCLAFCLTAGSCSVRFSVALCNVQQIHDGIFSV